MKKVIGFFVLISLCIAFTVFSVQRKSTVNGPKSVKNVRMIAHFDSSVISGTTMTVPTSSMKSQEVRKLLEYYDVHKTQAIFRNRYNSLGLLQPPVIKNNNHHFLEGWQLILIEGKAKAEELVYLLKEQKGVKEAFIELPFRTKPSISPNDSYFVNGSQWHLKSIQNPLADIDAEAAWDINRGRNDVIIAVADGGVDYNHPDLDPGDRSRVIAGYDFGDFDSDPMDDLPDNHPESYADHGTRVAGAIGAITNNSTGVSGVMWNCKIMPLKMVSSFNITYPYIGTIFDFSTTALPVSSAMAIDYAVNHGAHVINMSYGISGLGYTLAVATQQLSVLYDAIANAYDNNVVLVAAMGNEYGSGNPIEYPAGFHEVIAVGQTNSSLQRVGTSNTGPNIDVSAPGTYHTTSRNNSYNVLNGTSSATPVVSGVAGLVISQGLDRGFNLTNDDVKHILETTADDIQSYGIGWDEETGYGKVNAYNALQLLDEPNHLYHYTSTGGTSVKLQTLDKWILTARCGGLAAGMYLNVDQYRITKHVTFNVPFCSTPRVWMRERQSKSLSYSTANNGRPYCVITNVSNTGFDIEYAAYYVRYNLLGQTLNAWVPAAPASTYVAYTAVGEPNLAATAGPISGPYLVCSPQTFTLNNVTGATVTWSATPSNLFSPSSGTGTTATIGPAYAAARGTGTLTFAVTKNCGSFNITKPILVGGDEPVIYGIPPDSSTPLCAGTINGAYASPSSDGYYYWEVYGGTIIAGQGTNSLSYAINTLTPPETSGSVGIVLTVHGACGNPLTKGVSILVSSCGGGGVITKVYPNPASDILTIEIDSRASGPTGIFDIRLYDSQGRVLRQSGVKEGKVQFNVAGLKDGIYYLHIYDGRSDKPEVMQIIVQH